MNRDDLAEGGLIARQLVNLPSHFQGVQRTIRDFSVIPYDIPRRCTATYYPETNPLVAVGSVAEVSNTPASKSVVITIEASSGDAEGAAPGCRRRCISGHFCAVVFHDFVERWLG